MNLFFSKYHLTSFASNMYNSLSLETGRTDLKSKERYKPLDLKCINVNYLLFFMCLLLWSPSTDSHCVFQRLDCTYVTQLWHSAIFVTFQHRHFKPKEELFASNPILLNFQNFFRFRGIII